VFNFFKKDKDKVNKATDKNVFYSEKNALVIYFKCSKCGEMFRSYLRKGYDFITDYDSGGYKIDKEYIGSKCFNKIHLIASFDRNYKLLDFSLDNGEVISEKEWEDRNNG